MMLYLIYLFQPPLGLYRLSKLLSGTGYWQIGVLAAVGFILDAIWGRGFFFLFTATVYLVFDMKRLDVGYMPELFAVTWCVVMIMYRMPVIGILLSLLSLGWWLVKYGEER